MAGIVGLGIPMILFKMFSSISPRFIFIAYLCFLFTIGQFPVQAAVLFNPCDYSGSGDWDGTAGDDQITNTNGASVNGDLNGLEGDGIINNAGTVTGTLDGGSGEDTITISGQVDHGVYGTHNYTNGASGGYNTIIIEATGVVNGWLLGTNNSADNTTGGNNTLTIAGYNDYVVIGSWNNGINASGGSDSITVEAGGSASTCMALLTMKIYIR